MLSSASLIALALVAGPHVDPSQPGPHADPTICKTFTAGLTRAWVKDRQVADAALREKNPTQDVVRRNVQTFGFKNVAGGRSIVDHNEDYTHQLTMGKPTNQEQSGRCHIFAICNVVRSIAMDKKIVPADFEFSESYLYFYEMLEKANFYLVKAMEQIIGQGEKGAKMGQIAKPDFIRGPKDPGMGDGGWWTWDAYLIRKYGMVPRSVMPETKSSSNSDTLNDELMKDLLWDVSQMVQMAQVELDALKSSGASSVDIEVLKGNIRRRLQNYVIKAREDVWTILATHLGTPPSIDESFEFRLDPKRDHTETFGLAGPTNPAKVYRFTPHTFVSDFLKVNLDDFVVVVSNPFRPSNAWYEVSNSAIGVPNAGEQMDNLRMLNVTNDRMKELVQASINQNVPVWFGADVRQDVDYQTNIMHPDVFRTDDVYGFHPDSRAMPLVDRLRYHTTELDHAMVFTAFDQPPSAGGKVIKYRVENSWGPEYQVFHMYDDWFSQYVFMVVVPKTTLNAVETTAIGKAPEVIKEDDWEIP